MLDPIIVLPVPPGVILMSAFEDDEILLSCIVKLSIVVVVKVVAPLTPNVLDRVAPAVTAKVDVAVKAPSMFVAPFT